MAIALQQACPSSGQPTLIEGSEIAGQAQEQH